jgi:hypothetical protein
MSVSVNSAVAPAEVGREGLSAPAARRTNFARGSATLRVMSGLPRWVWLITAVAVVWGAASPNPVLTAAAVVLLPFCGWLLWRAGEPPLLVFACAMQWLQAAVLMFYANYYGLPLVQAFGGNQLELAIALSLGGVLALALGMRVALFRTRESAAHELAEEGGQADVLQLFLAYLAAFVVASLAAAVGFGIPGLAQFFLNVESFKWVFVFMLGYAVLEQRRGFRLLMVCVVIEVAAGFTGFFSSFKGVFFVMVVVICTAVGALQGRRLFLIGATAAVLLVLSSAWQAVKGEYREFLNEGYKTQEVLVPVGERFSKLSTLVTDFDWNQMVDGFQQLILRIGYVEFFARTIVNVPENLPYENGALWGGAVKHALMPRLFFPNKPILDDSERTSYYTGIDVSGAEQGTSIGIGYFGESYIDFGPVFMFVPIFFLGVFYGLIYRCFVIRARYKLLGSGIASSILIFGAFNIETSNIKLVGGNVVVLLLLSVFYRAFGTTVTQWLSPGSGRSV